jgi:membrane associated rhomboid family serine protease
MTGRPAIIDVGVKTAQKGAKGRAVALPFVMRLAAARLAATRATTYFGSTRQVRFPVTRRYEPIFNVPPVVRATVAVLVLVHAVRMLALTGDQDDRFVLTFAFIPARYGTDVLGTNVLGGAGLPGGFAAELWSFFTYAFIHADLMHIGFNLAWLLPFGTALARRFGAWRYVGFMLVTAAAGAFAYLIADPGDTAPMIGASAAISGAMAAAMRFVFRQGGPLGAFRDGNGEDNSYRVPATPLLATLRDPRFLIFVGVWLGLNGLFGLGTISIGGEEGQQIAWQAHIGGFVAGLLLFNAFDPVVPGVEPDAEPGS